MKNRAAFATSPPTKLKQANVMSPVAANQTMIAPKIKTKIKKTKRMNNVTIDHGYRG